MRKLMVLAAMLAMMLVAAAPAFAQQSATGGKSFVSGGSIYAKNSTVAQCQNLFNVSGNVVQQSSSQQQTAVQIPVALALLGNATANAVAVQSSNQSGISIGNVTQSCKIALAK